MQGSLQKWGNSLGLRIPAKLSQELHLKPGTHVDIIVKDKKLIIMPQHLNLDALLEQITPDNCHHEELDDEQPLGKESW